MLQITCSYSFDAEGVQAILGIRRVQSTVQILRGFLVFKCYFCIQLNPSLTITHKDLQSAQKNLAGLWQCTAPKPFEIGTPNFLGILLWALIRSGRNFTVLPHEIPRYVVYKRVRFF
jgi:hypothetical protein